MDSSNRFDQYSEEAMIAMASKGDLNAFNQLVLNYQSMAYNYAHTLVGDPAWAEDITQDSFIKAFQNISGFHGGSFRTWLLRIVTNTSYDLLRRFKAHPEQPLFPVESYDEEVESTSWLIEPSTPVEKTVEQNEAVKRLYQLLGELPIAYRRAITLVDVFELDYKEAARITKVPLGTMKSRLARARWQIKEKLLEDQEDRLNIKQLRDRVYFGR
jgi:RNA polymerase sigma-70 factor (ECF subfamily)